jgi:hypothetical protein
MSTLKLVYGDKVLFEKEVTLTDRQQVGASMSVFHATMNETERAAYTVTATAEAVSRMTPEQKAEWTLTESLPKEERMIVAFMAQRDSAEQRLKQLIK